MEHLTAQGLDAAAFIARIDEMFEKLLGPKPNLPEKQWLLARVSIIAAIEHLTTVLGTFFWTKQDQWLREGGDPQMVRCLQWHASEEVEHRRVAFEVARALGAGARHRAAAMAIVFPVLTGIWAKGTAQLMRTDPTKPGPATWGRFARHGLDGAIPSFPQLVGHMARYLAPGHDPHDENEAWPQARAFLQEFERRSTA